MWTIFWLCILVLVYSPKNLNPDMYLPSTWVLLRGLRSPVDTALELLFWAFGAILSNGSVFDFEPFFDLVEGFATEVAVLWDAICDGSLRSFFLVRSLENDDVAVTTSSTVFERRSRVERRAFDSGWAVEAPSIVASDWRTRFRRGLSSWLEGVEDTFVAASAESKAFLAPQWY